MAPLRRFGRPGLLGTAARTAVIAGTAQATAGAVGRRQANRAQQRYEAQQYEQQSQAPVAPPQPVAPQPVAPQPVAPQPMAQPRGAGGGGANDELLAQLTQLGDLHGQGVLTDEEFAAAKAKLLR